MKSNYVSLLALLLIIVTLSGCVQQNKEQKVPLTESSKVALSTLEPSDMALQLSDFPGNFAIKERTERVKSDVREDAIDLGWKKGYYVRYARIGDSILDVTVISHFISVYPVENVSKVLNLPKKSDKNITYDELSKPNTGDNSRAFRITTKDEFGTEEKYYQIEFVRMDVYVSLYMVGTTTDYELLKGLAKKAEAKIK